MKPLDFAHVGKQREVAVYGAEADIRKLLSDICVNNIGSGMVFPAAKKIFDQLPLSAVFQRHIGSPLKSVIITVFIIKKIS